MGEGGSLNRCTQMHKHKDRQVETHNQTVQHTHHFCVVSNSYYPCYACVLYVNVRHSQRHCHSVCVSSFACRTPFFYAREPISVSQFDTRLVRTSMLIHVNCCLFTVTEVWAASLQQEHATTRGGLCGKISEPTHPDTVTSSQSRLLSLSYSLPPSFP